MTFEEFCSCIVEVVKAATGPTECQSLNSFAVIEEASELNSANMGKTLSEAKEEVYFYSRYWAASDQLGDIFWAFPVLVVERISAPSVINPVSKNRQRISTDLRLTVLDQLKDPASNSGACAGRGREAIYSDTKTLLFTLLQKLRELDRNIEHRIEQNNASLNFITNATSHQAVGCSIDLRFTERVKCLEWN